MFYTYVWTREDGTPYYVGKGKGNRVYSNNHRHLPPSIDRIVLYIAKDEKDAFETEKALIWYYGRKDLGLGCLRNLTDGGENPPSNKGKVLSEEIRQRMSLAAKGIVKRKRGFRHSEETKQRMRHKHNVKIKTVCIRGHLLTKDNLRNNGRSCRLCENITQQQRRNRNTTQGHNSPNSTLIKENK